MVRFNQTLRDVNLDYTLNLITATTQRLTVYANRIRSATPKPSVYPVMLHSQFQGHNGGSKSVDTVDYNTILKYKN